MNAIRVWYFNEDLGDGSTAARYYVSEQVCQNDFDKLEGDDSTHHYNDGYIHSIDFLIDDFEIVDRSPQWEREYSIDKNLSGFDKWFREQGYENHSREDWEDKWDKLKSHGFSDPSIFLEDIIDLI